MKHAVIGRSVPRIDGREKVTGAAKYTGDLQFPNMLYGKILTSPHAHARILSIDTSEAEKMPGVKAVITHQDVPTLKYGISPARWDENIFCIDKVRFVGDKVAAVACVDEETCYGPCAAIKVEYEVLPAVLDFLHAMDEGAAPGPRGVRAQHQHRDPPGLRRRGEGLPARPTTCGTDAFLGNRTYQAPIEPHSAISMWEGDKLTVYSSTQSPHYFQYYIAREFGLPMGDVRVIKPYVGGGFGGKLEPTGPRVRRGGAGAASPGGRCACSTTAPRCSPTTGAATPSTWRSRTGVDRGGQDPRRPGQLRDGRRRLHQPGHRHGLLRRGPAAAHLRVRQLQVRPAPGLHQPAGVRGPARSRRAPAQVRLREPPGQRRRGPGHRPHGHPPAQRAAAQHDHPQRVQGELLRDARVPGAGPGGLRAGSEKKGSLPARPRDRRGHRELRLAAPATPSTAPTFPTPRR